MKVVHLLSTHEFSGAENVAVQISKLLLEDFNVDSIYVSPNGKIQEILKAKGVQYYPIEKMNIKSIKGMIANLKPDLIHAHDAMASVLASFATKSIPIVSQIHGNHSNMRVISPKSLLFRLTNRSYKQIIWVSQSALDNYIFKKSVANKSEVIVNVVNDREILKQAELNVISNEFDSIFLGRLNSIKDPLRAANILKLVIQKIPNYKAVYVGDGDLREELELFIKENELQNNISVIGFIDQPIDYLSKAKTLLMTSVYEGTPMAALEAMALSIPIVTTPTDGMVQLVDQGVSGFKSDEDSILVESLINLHNDSKLYAKLKEGTINRFKEVNNTEKYSKSIYEIYVKSLG